MKNEFEKAAEKRVREQEVRMWFEHEAKKAGLDPDDYFERRLRSEREKDGLDYGF